jgi:Ca2+-dependent lipid-binding protein
LQNTSLESNFYFVRSFYLELNFIFYLFSNHCHGQDILHLDVYDKDLIRNDQIGSVQIDLHDLYEKGFFLLPYKTRLVSILFS